ncbi:hypothetical protein FQN49_001900 [Arthroderma sp. PD_2]|nr:hypothetical protein FQN49_001900 [Arthroderma sp. PD_2]
MKFNSSLLVAAISFGSSLVQASPMAVAEAIATQKMTYMGPITPGGENVTLLGDAREIHAQIMKLNPKFNPMDFPDESTKLHKRSKVGALLANPKAFWPGRLLSTKELRTSKAFRGIVGLRKDQQNAPESVAPILPASTSVTM